MDLNYFKHWLGVGLLAIMISGCKSDEPPVRYSLTAPAENEIRFQAQLMKRYGIGLDTEFDIKDYGSIFVTPENSQGGFGFGFQFNSRVFDHDEWFGYQEVEALPTGAAFPFWVSGKVMDIEVPPVNSKPIDWHLYVGTRGQMTLGLAAVIHEINGRFPDVDLQYTFYDKKGHVILGLMFFGPEMNGGALVSPGGIFVGTDLTPFIPENGLPVDPDASDDGVSSLQNALLAKSGDWVERATLGQVIEVEGKSIDADISLFGRDADHYRGKKKRILNLVEAFGSASK